MRRLLLSCMAVMYLSMPALADPVIDTSAEPDSLRDIIKSLIDPFGVDISGQWFIAFEAGDISGTPKSDFIIKRGYINFKKEIAPGISGRITPDISVDREGDGEGDLEMRLKYCFVNADLPEFGFFTKPEIEFGLVARPWLAFEQKVNHYRVQGHMFLESAGILNSADFGAQFTTLLGGTMDKKYRKTVSSKYPGKYGSLAIGVFNGGGYHAIENNINKTIEGRLTVRPLPYIIPGLQLTYTGVYGKGNVTDPADWNMNVGFISFEHPNLVLTGTYFTGAGDYKSKSIDANGVALDQVGYSAFGELRCYRIPISLFGRFDTMTDKMDDGDVTIDRLIAGVAYRITNKSKILVDYQIDSDQDDETRKELLKLSVEFAF